MAGPAQHEELAKLGKPVAKPPAVAIRHSDHRRGHRDELVAFELDERRRVGLTDSCRGEEERRGNAEHGRESREDDRAWLLNSTRL